MIATATPTISDDFPYCKVCYSDDAGTSAFTHTEQQIIGGGTTDPIFYILPDTLYSEITHTSNKIPPFETLLSHRAKNPFEQDIFKSILARHGTIKRDQFNRGAISQINRGAK